MSAPDPAKWEATDRECEELSWPGGAQAVAELVARRRAIEELRALYLAICPGCANGRACYFSNIISACPTQKIQDRIAAIESEEA